MKGLTLLIPGQGNQHATMFDRVKHEPAARLVLEQAAEITGFDLPRELQRRPAAAWFENGFAQPLICAAVLATWHALRDELPPADLVLGYSVGELAAYGVAGAFDPGAVLNLARQRARLMDKACDLESGLLAIIGLDQALVEQLCAERGAELAAINGPRHIVVGGTIPVLEQLRAAARTAGAKLTRVLDVRVASHTSLLESAVPRFARALRAAGMIDPPVPVLAGVDASAVRHREAGIAALSTALYRPLAWRQCMQTACQSGQRVFLEVGPGRALSRLLRDTYPRAVVRAVEDFASLRAAADWVHRELELPPVSDEQIVERRTQPLKY